MLIDLKQKRVGYLSSLCGLMLLLAALPPCIASMPAAAEESLPVESLAPSAPCKDLKPFNNIDELLYQFYINLESDCLFEMSVDELEKVWDIKILAKERLEPGQTLLQLWNSSDFRGKPYKSEKDAFFVEVSHRYKTPYLNEFRIIITNEYYDDYITLFPNGSFPKLLPNPLRVFSGKMIHGIKNPSKARSQRSFYAGDYKSIDLYTYFWLNSDSTKIISLDGSSGAVTGIRISSGDYSTMAKNAFTTNAK